MMNYTKTVGRKIISLLVTFALMMGWLAPGSLLSTEVHAAATGYANGSSGISTIAQIPLKLSDSSLNADGITISGSNKEVSLMLGLSNFIWQGAAVTSPYSLTSNLLENNNISIVTNVVTGSGITLNSSLWSDYDNDARIHIAFNYDIEMRKTVPFEVTVALAKNNVVENATKITLKGTVTNQGRIRYIDSNSSDLVIGNTYDTLCPTENIDDAVVHFYDKNVSIYTSLKKDEFYYGNVDNTLSATDIANMKTHPQITEVRHLTVSDNFKNGKLIFTDKGPTYQIYRVSDLEYLGNNEDHTSVDFRRFDYADSYYLAVRKFGESVPEKHKITYHSNGADSGRVPIDIGEYYQGDEFWIRDLYNAYKVLYNQTADSTKNYNDFVDEVSLKKANHFLHSWNTKPDGSGESYRVSTFSSISYGFFMPDEDLNLYAQWRHDDSNIIKELIKPFESIDGLDLTNLSLKGGDVVRLKLDESTFSWKNNQSMKITKELLEMNRVQLRTTSKAGSKLLSSVSFQNDSNGDAYVALAFVKNMGSGSAAQVFDFDISLYTFIDNKRQSASLTSLKGKISLPAVPSNKGSGSGGGGGGSTRIDSASNVAKATSKPVDITANAATTATKAAIASAKKAGAEKATVTFKNAAAFSLNAAKAMTKAADNMPLTVDADSLTATGAVDVRLRFNPAQVTKDINLTASTTSTRAKSVKSFFNKWFSNDIQVVSLTQQEEFGMPVEIILKLDKALNSDSLYFYSFNKTTNTYKEIKVASYRVDKNGYVHFTTTFAGDIVITDSPLKLK